MIFSIGLIASFMVVAVSLSIHQKTISILSIVLGLLVMTQYILLDKPVPAILAVVSIIYAGLSLSFSNKSFWKEKYCIPAVVLTYGIVFVVVNGWSFNIELLSLTGSVLMTFLVVINNVVVSKIIAALSGACWAVYQVFVGAYGQLPGQFFYFAGIVVSSIMMINYYRAGKPVKSVPEVGTLIIKFFNNKLSKMPVNSVASEA